MLMRSKLSAMFLLLALLTIGALQVDAQQPPNIDAALADLSAQVGQTVTLNNLSGFTWTELVFNDTSLGCPKDGETYTRTRVNGYQFLLTFNDIGYDYRVSLDSSIVVLCTSTAQNTATPAGGIPATSTAPAQPTAVFVSATPTTAPTETPNTAASLVPTSESIIIGQATSLPGDMPAVTVTLMGAAAAVQPTTAEVVPAATLDPALANLPPTTSCPGAPELRLTVGGWGQKINDNVALNVRADPARGTEVVTQLEDGTIFYVVEGPQCDPSGLSWFLIDFNGLHGWVAEGNETAYFVEPIDTPPPTATLGPVIPPTTDPALAPTAAPVATIAPQVAAPPIAANAINAANAAQVVELGTTGATAPGTVNAVAIGQPAGLPPGIILGAGGGLNLWGLNAPDALLASFGTPEQGYTPFAYSAFTNRLAAAEQNPDATWQIHVWDLNGLPGSVVDLHTLPITGGSGTVTALAFSPNGAMIAASQSGTGIVLYDVTSGTALATIQQANPAPASGLSFSANSQWMAVIEPPQSIHLWDVSGTSAVEVGTLDYEVNEFSALAFNPADSLLAVSTGSSVALWDMSAGVPAVPRETLSIYPSTGIVTDLAFSADGSVLATAGGALPVTPALTSDVQLWNVSVTPSTALSTLAVVVPLGDVLAFSPDGSRLVTLGADNVLRLWGVS